MSSSGKTNYWSPSQLSTPALTTFSPVCNTSHAQLLPPTSHAPLSLPASAPSHSAQHQHHRTKQILRFRFRGQQRTIRGKQVMGCVHAPIFCPLHLRAQQQPHVQRLVIVRNLQHPLATTLNPVPNPLPSQRLKFNRIAPTVDLQSGGI